MRNQRILLLRHGKPAAAIVPIHVAVPSKHRLSSAEIEDLFAGLGRAAPQTSAVDDLRPQLAHPADAADFGMESR